MRQTLRPRSGKEYQNIDRPTSGLVHQKQKPPSQSNNDDEDDSSPSTPTQFRSLMSGATANYANITPVPESVESPSPGYQSGDSMQEAAPDSLVCKALIHQE